MKLAGCILTDEQDKILLLHRNIDGLEQWEVPGGKREADEDLESTACRELKEETGMDVEIVRLLGNRAFVHNDRELEFSWFLAKIASGEVGIAEPQNFDDAQYFSLDEMQELKLSSGAKAFLDMLVNDEIKL